MDAAGTIRLRGLDTCILGYRKICIRWVFCKPRYGSRGHTNFIYISRGKSRNYVMRYCNNTVISRYIISYTDS